MVKSENKFSDTSFVTSRSQTAICFANRHKTSTYERKLCYRKVTVVFMKKQKEKRRYTTIGSFIWAMKRMWKLDPRFLFYVFAAIPFAILAPLLSSYFTKLLLDALGGGAGISKLLAIIVGFTVAQILLDVLTQTSNSLCSSRKRSKAFSPCSCSGVNRCSFHGREKCR